MNIVRKYCPPGYVLCSAAISIGGFLNGYDTGSIGAITDMPFFKSTFGTLTPLMQGFTVSLVMLTGFFPSFYAGQLAAQIGHLKVIFAGAVTMVVGTLLEATATKLAQLLVGRAAFGLGQGILLSNMYVYITEISPAARRGMLVSTPQMLCVFGICLGYFTCYGSIEVRNSFSFRIPFIIEAVLSAALAGFCLVLPSSPRWLLMKERRAEAEASLEKLNFSRVEAEKDFLNSTQREAPPPKNPFEAFFVIFRKEYRLRTFLALFVLGMAQLSGIDGVMYYAPILFAHAGIPSQSASFLASGVSAILMLLVSIPATIYADKLRRRHAIIGGGLAMATCMLIMGSLYASNVVIGNPITRYVVVVCIFVWALIYTYTWAVVGKIYASEIQPAQTRAAASCVAQGLGFFTNWLVAFSTPVFLADSSYGPYFLFGGFTLFTAAVLGVYMPETHGLSLEAIQEAFRRPVVSARSWQHQLRRWFSWAGLSADTSSSSSGSSHSGGSSAIELDDILREGPTGQDSPIEVGGSFGEGPSTSVDAVNMRGCLAAAV